MAGLAWAPTPPKNLKIGGAVQPSTKLSWEKTDDTNLTGYKIYWRETTAPQWQFFRFVGETTEYTLEGIVIDNYLFGVAAVGNNGNESIVVFPGDLIPRR